METVKIIGFLAAAISTATFLPQLYKVWRRKSADSLSFSMLLMYNISSLCWLTYGILIKSLPVILCNSITLLIGFVLIWLKYFYENHYSNHNRPRPTKHFKPNHV